MGTVVEEQLQTIQDNVDDAYTALGSKGATLPAVGSRGTENLASTISTVPAADPVNKVFDVTNGVLKKPTAAFSVNTFAGATSVANNGLKNAFNDRTELTGSVSFPDLTTIGESGLSTAFSGCTGLTGSVLFPELTTVGGNGLSNAFSSCTRLTTISFPKLTTVTYQGLIRAFSNCYGLTGSVSFPKLTTVGNNALYNTFSNCSGLTEIHFRQDMQSTIEGLSYYSTKFGATNATIYFDL